MKTVAQNISDIDSKVKEYGNKVASLSLLVPNMLHKSVPDGKTESDNTQLREWGVPASLSFKPGTHIEIGKKLGIIDCEVAAKIAGRDLRSTGEQVRIW